MRWPLVRSLGRSERWSQAAPGVPHCKHSHLFTAGDIVDVIACSFEQDTARIRYGRLPIGPPDMWRVAEQIKSCREFAGEQVGRGSAILAPPLVDGADLRISFRCGSDRQAHCRRRSSFRISSAGRRLPASADFQDAESASCKACRSSLVRSSPSSSATRSTIVPSGKVVGSSRTRRPFSTRARRAFIPPTLRDSREAGKTSGADARRCSACQFRDHIPGLSSDISWAAYRQVAL